MKTSLRAITMLVLLVISSSVFVYCHEDFENEGQVPTKADSDFVGEICNGKKIQKFNTMAELQQRHLMLYQQYMASNEDEQVLVNYENSINFYSLRKKEQDMDEGIIPNDPNFDETNFTFDPILETLLNQDGMIIIANRLYVWDSGCVIHSIPFACKNYARLLAFYQAAQTQDNEVMLDMFISGKMRNHNICDDKLFDFEAISENGGRVEEGGVPRLKNKNGCGYDLVLNTKLESCQDGFYTYIVSAESIAPLGTDPYKTYYIKATVGNADEIEIYDPLLGTWGAITLQDEDTTWGYIVPFNPTNFKVRIPSDATDPMICDISVYSIAYPLSGNSCPASYTASVNNDCPFTIEAIKNSVSETTAQWTFSLNGAQGCPVGGSKVTWNFGDGTSVTGGFTVTHNYTVPCYMQYVTVTATVDGVVCGVMNKMFTKPFIPYGNPCTRTNYTFDTHKETIDGKNVKVKAKIKKNAYGKSVLKNVFKWRIDGTKTIKSIGTIYQPSANNSSCNAVNIETIMPPKQTNGKKRNKQKEKFSTLYHISAVNPYQVKFTHSNGYNHTLIANGLYCSQ